MIFATRILKLSIFSAGLALATCTPLMAAPTDTAAVIYQVQTGTPASASQEFVSVYNNSSQPIDVTGWCVVYSSSSDVTQTQLGCLAAPERTKLLLPAHTSFTLSTLELASLYPAFTPDIVFKAGIAATSGHLKLLDADKNLIDLVGWGAATKPEGVAANAPPVGQILQRIKTADNILQDLGNNSYDFYSTQFIMPTGGNLYEDVVANEAVPVFASGLVINELLPDVAGSDAGNEFIELYNSSDQPLNIKGYSLQLGPAYTKSFTLPDKLLSPRAYTSFTDVESGLILPNTSSSVRLLAPDSTILQTTDTYNDLGEDVSWAYITGKWQKTYQPTPGSQNLLLADKPCQEGQARSPETGFCRQISVAAVASGMTLCKEGQVRNVDTNRCRNSVSVPAAAVCKPGQQRNTDTNRCRNVLGAQTAKVCPTGQTRNAETNRCRKAIVAGSSATSKVKDVPSPLVANNVKWWLAGLAALGSVAYAGYEWRREVRVFILNLKNKLVPNLNR